MEKKIIYLDHAATTATRPEVVDAINCSAMKEDRK